jgi:hypothetical protein
MLKKSPIIETQTKGAALKANILLLAPETALSKEIPSHFDFPANLGGRSISISIVLNPTHAPRPRKKR